MDVINVPPIAAIAPVVVFAVIADAATVTRSTTKWIVVRDAVIICIAVVANTTTLAGFAVVSVVTLAVVQCTTATGITFAFAFYLKAHTGVRDELVVFSVRFAYA
jgi:hypothetical protein